jgi:hypothetical protein
VTCLSSRGRAGVGTPGRRNICGRGSAFPAPGSAVTSVNGHGSRPHCHPCSCSWSHDSCCRNGANVNPVGVTRPKAAMAFPLPAAPALQGGHKGFGGSHWTSAVQCHFSLDPSALPTDGAPVSELTHPEVSVSLSCTRRCDRLSQRLTEEFR